MSRRIVELAVICFCTTQIASAQEFRLFDRSVQIHGFASQGFAYTDLKQLADDA